MLFAQNSEAVVAAVFTGLLALIGVGVPAYLALKKAWADAVLKAAEAEQAREERDAALAKTIRNGEIEDLEKALKRCGSRNDAADTEIINLRGQIGKLYGELAELRRLVTTKDVRIEGQATQVEKLQTAVTLMKDAAPVTNLPAGTEVKIPESTMKEKG